MLIEAALAALLTGQGLDTATTLKFRADGCHEANVRIYGETRGLQNLC